jgi:hypothetical protein
MKQHPPGKFSKNFSDKNAIKPKIGGTPLAILLESLDSPRDFGKNMSYPPGFSARVHLW